MRPREPESAIRQLQRLLAGILIASGMLLLFAAVSYYTYGHIARSNLDSLSFATERPSLAVSAPSPEASYGNARTVGVPTLGSPTAGGRDTPAESPSVPATTASIGGLQPRTESLILPVLEPDGAVYLAGSTNGRETGVVGEGSRRVGVDSSEQAAVVETREPVSTEPAAPQVSVPSAPPAQVYGSASQPRTEAVRISALNQSQAPAVTQQPGGQIAEATGDGPGSVQSKATDASDTTASGPEAAALTGELSEPLGAEPEAAAVSSDPTSEPEAEELVFLAPEPGLLPNDPSPASRIIIPAIKVDSEVTELGLAFTDKGYAWETPKHVVGHVPTTPRPGAQGLGWYFGHLESPIRREGNVFQRLPEIPKLLEEYTLNGGEPVHIILESPDRSYLYQVYRAETVPQDDLHLIDSGNQDITLVSCVPRLIYDHRLLVTAALVGVSES